MATRSGWTRSFTQDPELQQYFLDQVKPTGKTLGVGSYGSVVEVKHRQLPCAAKCIHELLLDPDNEGVHGIVDKYQRECRLMSSLRHPNITQFLGLCFLEGSKLPLLVMEKLELSVDDFLECAPNVPLPFKLSILIDTCSGLIHLHSMDSPIVHRDLTARNVLLTSSLTAKITDLGNSRMVTFRPGQLAHTLTKSPGTIVYMPPEALSESHRYGPSLDVFSFGHLALYVLIQKFPGNLLSPTHTDPQNPGHVVGRTEVERREVYMKKLEDQLMKSHPILVELVTNCLHNNAQMRPSAEQILETLQPVQLEMDKVNGGYLEKILFVANVLHMKETKHKNRRIEEHEISENRLETINQELMADIARLKQNLEASNVHKLKADITELQTENKGLKEENTQLTHDTNTFKTEIKQLNSECHQLKNQLAAEKLKLESCHKEETALLESRHLEEKNQLKCHYQEEKRALMLELEQLRREMHNKATVSQHGQTQENGFQKLPLQLKWNRGPDMPVAMSVYIQSVEINGTIYVGGGLTDKSEYYYIVMAYNTRSSKWYNLPPYSTRWFAMTAFNGRLVLVGGRARDYSYSNELGEWQPDSNQWIRPFPPMSKPRREPSATSYKHWLVVAGGYDGNYLDVVEVLDVSQMQWSTAPSTPIPWMAMKSTVIGETWYLMRGCCGDMGYVPDVFSVSLQALVSHSLSGTSSIWKKLPGLNCALSCPLNIQGSLLAVGGRDKSKNPMSTIYLYVPDTNTWVQAGQLPHALYTCSCVVISNKIHVIGGWDGKSRQKKYFTSALL